MTDPLTSLMVERHLVAWLVQVGGDEELIASLRPKDFAEAAHRMVVDLAAMGDAPTPEVLRRRILAAGKSGESRTLDVLVRHAIPDDFVPSLAWAEVAEKAKRRRGVQFAEKLRHAFAEGDAAGARQMMERALERQLRDDVPVFETFTVKEAVERLLETMVKGDDSRARHVELGPLNPLAGHLLPGMFTTIGGDTGTGKSTLALWLMEQWEKAGGVPAVVSLEDRADIWANRWIGSRIHYSFLNRREMREAFAAYSDFESEVDLDAERSIFQHLNDNGVGSILDGMRDVVRRGADLVVVDYLQEAAEPENAPSRVRFLANAARSVKSAAKRLGVPVVMLSQLSRPSEKKRRIPTRWDLKGTGDLENMSEAIILLWKPDRDGATFGIADKYKNDAVGDMFRVDRGGAGTVRALTAVERDAFDDGSSGGTL
ncbi:MAG: DnaB-like helicase C-terminal domain-containing protein [Myxococcota bacterium]